MYSHFIIASTQLYLVANDVSCTCARWSHSSEPLSGLLSSSLPYRWHHVLSFCLQHHQMTIDYLYVGDWDDNEQDVEAAKILFLKNSQEFSLQRDFSFWSPCILISVTSHISHSSWFMVHGSWLE